MGNTTKYWYHSYEWAGETRYSRSADSIEYATGDKVRYYWSAHDPANPAFFLCDSTSDELNRKTDYFYDSHFNIDSLRYSDRWLAWPGPNPTDVTTRYYSTPVGNDTMIEDPNGHKTRFRYAEQYGGAHLTETRVDMLPEGDGDEDLVTRYGYDFTRGAMDTMTYYHDYPSSPITTFYEYDVFSRLSKITHPGGSTEMFTYDRRGNLIRKIVSVAGVDFYKIEYEYDAMDHLTKVKEFERAYAVDYDSTVYVYNQHGEMTEFINANDSPDPSTVIEYTYDGGRLVKVSYADGHTDSLIYHADGKLKAKIDRKGQVTEYFYSPCSGCPSRGWLVKKRYFTNMAQYPGSPSDSVVFAYDAVGNDTLMIDWNGEVKFQYDDLDRLSGVEAYEKTKQKHQYDLVGNRTLLRVVDFIDASKIYVEQTYPMYDEANRLRRTTVDSENYDLTYWDTGQLRLIIYPNDCLEQYTLTPRNFVREVTTVPPGTTVPVFRAYYTCNPVGDRSSVDLTITPPDQPTVSGAISYLYDDLRRLKRVVYPSSIHGGKTVNYSCDPVGNRIEKEVNGARIEYTYDKRNNHLLTAGDVQYSFDANGNLTDKRPVGETGYEYSHDFENRLTKVKKMAPQDSLLLTYCGLGKRIKKTGIKDTTAYVYDGMYAVCEFDGLDNLKASYVYANGLLLGRIERAEGGVTPVYYHHDALTSTMGLTDEAGSVAQAYLYDEFGNLLESWGGVDNHYLYTAQEWDADIESTELYNLRARYYDSTIGRFVSEDPELQSGRVSLQTFACCPAYPSTAVFLPYLLQNPQLLNGYLYVANNPINFADPTGWGTRKCNPALKKCLEKAIRDALLCLVVGGLPLGELEALTFLGCALAGPAAPGCWTAAAVAFAPAHVALLTTCGLVYFSERRDCYRKYDP